MKAIKERLTYANVMATLAMFVALGGSSYAAANLPRNSVGASELKANSVGAAEIRRKAVRSSEISDRSIRLRDISKSARNALHGEAGPAGPPGPTFSATIDSSGVRANGNAIGSSSDAFGTRLITFGRSVATCVPSVSIANVPGGTNPTPPAAAQARAETTSDGQVLVRMFDPAGNPQTYGFNLIVAC
jgi:hypothetical protein